MSSHRTFAAAVREWLDSESESQLGSIWRSILSVVSISLGLWGLIAVFNVLIGDIPPLRLPGALLLIAGAVAGIVSRRVVLVSDARRYSLWAIAGTAAGGAAIYLSWLVAH